MFSETKIKQYLQPLQHKEALKPFRTVFTKASVC